MYGINKDEFSLKDTVVVIELSWDDSLEKDTYCDVKGLFFTTQN